MHPRPRARIARRDVIGSARPRVLPSRLVATLAVIVAIGAPALAPPASASSVAAGPWPMSSDRPVEPLAHPTLEERVTALGDRLDAGSRLVVFGDQRALADGEWQDMITLIRAREDEGDAVAPLLAVVDTGDIVFDGSYSDQFHMLRGILEPLSDLPYLVAVGNHEVHNNRPGPARENVVRFLGPSLGAEFSEKRMYYRRDVAGVRMIFLDSNDLVYGPDGDFTGVDGLTYRGRAQLRWLTEQLAPDPAVRATIVALHHPFVASSEKHRQQAAKVWSLEYDGRTLPRILADGGVDLVLAGHTHTYERFAITSPAGDSFQLVNVSGRPRNDFLWLSKGARRARDLAGDEIESLRDAGWSDLDGWKIEQTHAMLGDGANQWLELRIGPDGTIEAEAFFLVDEGRGGARSGDRFVVAPGGEGAR